MAFSSSISDKSLPKAKIIFFLLGVAVLLPWNAYITAVDYFTRLYPDSHVNRLFSVVYIPGTLVSIAVGGHPTLTPFVRVVMALVGYVLTLVAVPVANFWHEQAGGTAGLLLLVCAVFVAGTCCGLSQPALFAEAANTHYTCVQALQAGNGASAVLVIMLRMVSKSFGSSTQTLRASTFVYFAITLVFCVVTFALYLYGLPKLLVYQAGRRASSLNLLAKSHKTQVQTVSLLSEDCISTPIAQPLVTPAQSSVYLIDESGVHAPGTLIADDTGVGNESSEPLLSNVLPTLGVSDDEEAGEGEVGGGWGMGDARLWKLIRVPSLSIFLTYLVTLSIFPGFLSEDVQSKVLGDWYPVLLFFTFAASDYTSRVFVVRDRDMLPTALARLLLFPGFAYCSVFGASPVLVFTLTAVFGFSNGLLTNTAMLSASQHAAPEHTEEAGNIMCLFLHLGLLLGSYVGWMWLVI